MDGSTIALCGGVIAAAMILLKPSDLIPMLVDIAIILGGLALMLWMFTNPEAANTAQNWAETTGLNLLLLLVAQPFIFGLALLLARLSNKLEKHWAGPYTVQREGEPGAWSGMATTPSYWQARKLAHDGHRRVLNANGQPIYRGRK